MVKKLGVGVVEESRESESCEGVPGGRGRGQRLEISRVLGG